MTWMKDKLSKTKCYFLEQLEHIYEKALASGKLMIALRCLEHLRKEGGHTPAAKNKKPSIETLTNQDLELLLKKLEKED